MACAPTSERFARPFVIPCTRARRGAPVASVAQYLHRAGREALRPAAGGRVERRIMDGTPARVETLRRRSQGDGVINTAYIERLNATFRERLAPLARRGRALARRTR